MSWVQVSAAQAWSEAVDGYLDAVIPKAAAGSAAVEGSVQAAVSSFDSAKRAMLDREVMLHFRDTSTRKSVMDSVSADLLRSLEDVPVPGHGRSPSAVNVTSWLSTPVAGFSPWK
jgi:hypothetical protein